MDRAVRGRDATAHIVALTRFLNSLQSTSQYLVQHLRSGATLCHYTSLDGLNSIIGNSDLWLTNTRFCNDDEEMEIGHRLVDKIVDEFEKKPSEPKMDKPWFKQLRDLLEHVRNDQVYVTCFCERDNLLSQWRGYAENGGGVSIEFDAPGFQKVAGEDNDHGLMRLWKVFYDKEQQRQIVEQCLRYRGWPAGIPDKRIPFIVDALQFFVPTFKHEDFNQEQERRLIFTPSLSAAIKPRFRTRRGILVPYFSLRELSTRLGKKPNLKLPIKGITVGPSYNRDLNVASVKALLALHGYGNVPVKASQTPFRA